MTLKISVASDHAGFDLKSHIVEVLSKRDDVIVQDLGPEAAARCDYPDYAGAVAKAIQNGDADRGILVCGSGIGISMAANRFKGVRAALVHNAIAARLSREHNDANVICLGSRMIGTVVAFEAIDAFMKTDFEGGRHAMRVAKIDGQESS